MLTRIALVAPTGLAQKKLRTRLSHPLAYLVRDFQNMDEVQSGLAHFNFQVLILRLAAFEVGHAAMIERLASAYPHAFFITVSPSIHPQARYALRGLSRHTLIDEEFEIGDLEKLIALATVKTAPTDTRSLRLHPRVRRQGFALLIVKNEKGEEVRVRADFEDFARMGARLRLDALGFHVHAKTRVELHYRSSEDAERIHRIEARVVWCESANDLVDSLLKKKKAEIGLRFAAEL